MVNTRTLNSEGMETNFATNTLATYLITKMLLPLLRSSEDVCFKIGLKNRLVCTFCKVPFESR